MLFLLSNPFTRPLQILLEQLNGLSARLPLPEWVSSWSVALVLVAILVKVVTQPLTSKQQTSMRRMQELQPRLNELQKRFKDDREKLAQAQMELYKEQGVNPFGGCMPLLIQMVVLIGLWRAIMNLAGTEKADLLPTLEAIEEMARAPGLRPGARSYRRIAGYFTSSLFEIAHEWLEPISVVRVVCNVDLSPKDLKIAQLREARMLGRWNERSIEAESLLNRARYQRLDAFLAKRGFDPQMGARPMARLIQDTIRKALADELLFGRLVNGGKVTIDLDDADKVTLAFEEEAPKEAEPVA